MIKGLYAAASAMIANLTRQSLLAHNAANINTPGFKETMVTIEEFRKTPVLYPPGNIIGASSVTALGELGLGVDTSEETTNYSAGAFKNTGEALDLAINGDGFFRVRTPDGERYTRDGRFMLDADGTLVTVDGYPVLSNTGQTITITEDGGIGVGSDGTVSVNTNDVGQIGVAVFSDPATQLTRDLPNTFAANAAPVTDGAGTILQGALEMSNISPAQLLTQMVSVSRAYEAAQRLVSTQDELLGRALQTLGHL